ncbi:MAG: helix-turn-helix transcriptional regulator [Clostridiales bacterium]|nr:helix-turn-helix transcriptional regulator [Clostridiales bacterium]MDY5514842.1 helix-turn-helix transcriptional regulator [Candidatus Ventricola sp.]
MLNQNAMLSRYVEKHEVWKRLGAALRREREACGLTVREIECRSGVAFRTMYAYERAENSGGIDLKKLAALCAVIGCDLCDLLAEAMREETENEQKT